MELLLRVNVEFYVDLVLNSVSGLFSALVLLYELRTKTGLFSIFVNIFGFKKEYVSDSQPDLLAILCSFSIFYDYFYKPTAKHRAKFLWFVLLVALSHSGISLVSVILDDSICTSDPSSRTCAINQDIIQQDIFTTDGKGLLNVNLYVVEQLHYCACFGFFSLYRLNPFRK